MISLDVIEREIRELEARGDTTYSQCERLAWLYVVRDHLKPPEKDDRSVRVFGGSEFLDLCEGVNFSEFMQIMDAHMQALKVVCPKEYQAVIDKIKMLHLSS